VDDKIACLALVAKGEFVLTSQEHNVFPFAVNGLIKFCVVHFSKIKNKLTTVCFLFIEQPDTQDQQMLIILIIGKSKLLQK
jgi:hypothetical protein